MAEHSQDIGHSKGRVAGVNLDLGILQLNITLSISGISSLADTLSDALQQAGPSLEENVNKVVDTVRQLGVEDLKKWVQQGGEEEESVYNQLVSKLQQAAQKGQDQARNLLQNLGENVSAAGQKMQGAASKEEGSTH
jgi:ABC-type transporter Mla subunit MlaD